MRALIILLIVGGVGISIPAIAQMAPPTSKEANLNLTQLAGIKPAGTWARNFDGRYDGISGHAFLQTGWLDVNIRLEGEEEFTPYSGGNLDLVNQILVLNLPDDRIGTITLDLIGALEVNTGRKTKYIEPLPLSDIKGRGKKDLALFEYLHQGEYVLLKQLVKVYREADFRGAYNAGNTYDSYIEEHRYFLLIDGEYQRVRLKERSVLRALGDRADRAKELIRQNYLDLTQEAGIIWLLDLLERE